MSALDIALLAAGCWAPVALTVFALCVAAARGDRRLAELRPTNSKAPRAAVNGRGAPIKEDTLHDRRR